MADIIQIRRDSTNNWTLYNPVLAEGEFALDTNIQSIKIGNGIDNYSNCKIISISGNTDFYTTTQIDIMMDNKIDVPDPIDWINFDLILST